MAGERRRNGRGIDRSFDRMDDPPHSRLFIVCDKETTDGELRDAFCKFGDIEDVWVVRDRERNEPKGVAYIKFSKTSEAALAMESMDGQYLTDHKKPLKVLVAHSREDGSKRESNEEERLLRLFILIPKTCTEDDISKKFEEYGRIDKITIVRDRATGASKGLAYVKYFKMFDAALAYENCPKAFKPVFADPKPLTSMRSQSGFYESFSESPSGRSDSRSVSTFPSYSNFYGNDNMGGGNVMEDLLWVKVNVPYFLNREQLFRLFDLIPGLECCEMDGFLVRLKYSSMTSAAWARQKLDRFEYPPGCFLTVIDNTSDTPMGPHRPSHSAMTSSSRPSIHNSPTDSTINLKAQLSTLVDKITEVANVMRSAGIDSSGLGLGGLLDTPGRDPLRGMGLPPPQPLSPPSAPVAERLFFVCQPHALPEPDLLDLFRRFGNVIEVYLLRRRNHGYAKFADKGSAEEAIRVLHGFEVDGIRLKVMIAEPENTDRDRKRMRTDSDN